MAECKDQNDFNAKFIKNSGAQGYGMDTAQAFACPGCAEPGWKVCKLISMQEDMAKDEKCRHCGRSFKVEFSRPSPGQSNFEFVLTGGPDLPDWYVPKLRRV